MQLKNQDIKERAKKEIKKEIDLTDAETILHKKDVNQDIKKRAKKKIEKEMEKK